MSGRHASPEALRVVLSGSTDTGATRRNNEDNFIIVDLSTGTAARRSGESTTADGALPDVGVDDPGLLAIVADGMGGAAAGEIASAMTIESMRQWFEQQRPQGDLTAEDAERFLEEAIVASNEALFGHASDHPEMHGMGSTLTCTWIRDDTVHIAQVGDSRAYLFREGRIQQLTRDQSLREHLITEQGIDPEEASRRAGGHVILQAIGVRPEVSPVVASMPLRDGDLLLLCSDGLTDPLSDDIIAAVLASADDLDRAVQRLVEAANSAGGPDNITAVLLRVARAGALEATADRAGDEDPDDDLDATRQMAGPGLREEAEGEPLREVAEDAAGEEKPPAVEEKPPAAEETPPAVEEKPPAEEAGSAAEAEEPAERKRSAPPDETAALPSTPRVPEENLVDGTVILTPFDRPSPANLTEQTVPPIPAERRERTPETGDDEAPAADNGQAPTLEAPARQETSSAAERRDAEAPRRSRDPLASLGASEPSASSSLNERTMPPVRRPAAEETVGDQPAAREEAAADDEQGAGERPAAHEEAAADGEQGAGERPAAHEEAAADGEQGAGGRPAAHEKPAADEEHGAAEDAGPAERQGSGADVITAELPVRRKRRPWPWLLAVFLLSAAAGAAVWWWLATTT